MNKLTVPALLAATLSIAPAAHAAFPTLAEKEARVLKSYRDNPNASDLVGLSHIREDRGKFAEALQTWDLLKKTFGTSYSRAYMGSEDKIMTYNQLADWTAKRINAKRRGVRQASASTKRAADTQFKFVRDQVGWEDPTRIDLDGDGLEEIIVVEEKVMKVLKWRKDNFTYVWKGDTRNGQKISPNFLITGGEGKGWPQVFIIYATSDSSTSGHISTNGDSWIAIYN